MEEENKRVVRRSIVAKVDIPQGTIITEEMLDVKRPGTGIEPKHLESIVGNIARTMIKQDEIVKREKLKD